MILKKLSSDLGMLPRKLLHLGANHGQEVDAYQKAGVEGYHVEALPNAFQHLAKLCSEAPNQTAIQACIDAEEGNHVTFNVASNNGESSSLLGIGRHAVAYPSIKYNDKIEVVTQTVDGLIRDGRIPNDIDFALLDLQGAEARALKGAHSLLSSKSLWGLSVEIGIEPLYEGGADFLSLYQQILLRYGFYLRKADFNDRGWTDALFLRRWWKRDEDEHTPLEAARDALQPNLEYGHDIAPEGVCSQSSRSRWSKHKDAQRAVTEPLTGRFNFHTDLEDSPWWRVDFGKPREFDEVIVFNRTDTGSGRATGLILEISNDGQAWTELHQANQPFGGILSNSGPLRVACKGTVARIVRLRLPHKSFLHLDGVKIIKD